MIRRRLPALSLTGLLLFCPGSTLTLSALEGLSPYLAAYRISPLEAHQALKEKFREGESLREPIELIETATGDYSFEALKVLSPARVSALHLQREALHKWNDGAKSDALLLYEDARRLLDGDGGLTEAVFCQYLRAEILAEDERFVESLRLLDHALERVEGRSFLYLEALLHQSRGFSLWYLDKLAQSVAAFHRALEIWTRIAFNDGEVSSWNNLAALYEELDLPRRAGDCYLEALSRMSRRTTSEIRYPLLLNAAVFLKNEGDVERGLRFLELARPYRDLAPDDFALAEAELLGTSAPVLDLAPESVSVEVSRQILLGEARERLGHTGEALRHLTTAVELGRASGQRLPARRAALACGRLLEQKGRFTDAGQLYRDALDREELVFNIDAAFPFWRAVSPLFDGWVRSLVRRGRVADAREAIRRKSLLRLRKIEALLSAGVTGLPAGHGAEELAFMISLTDTRIAADADPFGHRPSPNDSTRFAVRDSYRIPAPDTTLVELWPDRESLFVWVENASETRFLELSAGEDILRLVRRVAEPLFAASHTLPPPPPSEAVRELSERVLHPMEAWFSGNRILLIPYKELQALPFELLELRDGRRLGERYITSYLPAPDPRFAEPADIDGPPLLLSSSDLQSRAEALRERRFFANLRPAPQIIERPSQLPPVIRGHWVHVAAHFRLHDRFWLFSSLGDRPNGMTLGEWMNRKLETRLLSLAVCDGANSYSGGFPYWFGTAEVFLLQGARSLVLSRWAIDERSSVLFIDLYREMARGYPIDEALFRARGKFLRAARRGAGPTDHPFFWAGVLYVGKPGKSLATATSDRGASLVMAAVLAFTFLLGAGSCWRRG